MHLKHVNVSPVVGSLETELFIKTEFVCQGISTIVSSITGYLFLDGIKIANLIQYEFGKGSEENLISIDRSRSADQRFSYNFLAPLSKKAIDALNESRSKTSKGDINFELKFSVNCFESSFSNIEGDSRNISNASIVTIPNDSLVRYRVYPFNHYHKIPASDWLHDFYPHFEIDQFIVLELPVIKSQHKFKKDNLNKRIHEALQSFDEMKKAFEQMDWNLVIKESRPIWELHRKQDEIALLLQSDDFSSEIVESFNALLQSLFNFASKFIHKEDRSKQILPYSKVSKEDAILVYTIAGAILNLINQKQKRAVS